MKVFSLADMRFLMSLFSDIGRSSSLLFCLVLIFNMCGALLEGTAYGFLILSFSSFSETTLAHVPGISFLLSYPWIHHFFEKNIFLCSLILGLCAQILKSTFCFLAAYCNVRAGTDLQYRIQKRIYSKILCFSFPSVNRYKIGELVALSQSPTYFVRPFLDNLNLLLISCCLIAVSIVILGLLSLPLTLFTILAFSLMFFFQKKVIKRSQRVSCLLSKQLEKFNSQTIQSLAGIRIVHLYNHQKTVLRRIASTLKRVASFSRNMSLLSSGMQAFNEIMSIALVGLCLVVGYFLLSFKTDAVIPFLLGFLAITYRLSVRASAAMTGINQLAGLKGVLTQMQSILMNENKEYIRQGGEKITFFEKSIVFQNVSFSYPNSTEPVLQNFSFEIKKGSSVALVGESGAGKSSLLDLLTALYEPLKGQILIDGKNLSLCDVNVWREKIAVVVQDAFIFNDTIEENIRFGNLNASSQEIIEAASSAYAHKFITALPLGYKTQVGERGYRLSGGERQRLALARALVKKADILILDEATSNLDSQSEKWIQESIEALKGKKTVIAVAHRLSTIMHADIIFVMDKGRLIEVGTHEELLRKEKKYAQLWWTQFEKKGVLTYA